MLLELCAELALQRTGAYQQERSALQRQTLKGGKLRKLTGAFKIGQEKGSRCVCAEFKLRLNWILLKTHLLSLRFGVVSTLRLFLSCFAQVDTFENAVFTL